MDLAEALYFFFFFFFFFRFQLSLAGAPDVARLIDRPHLEGVLALLHLDGVGRGAGREGAAVEAALEARDRAASVPENSKVACFFLVLSLGPLVICVSGGAKSPPPSGGSDRHTGGCTLPPKIAATSSGVSVRRRRGSVIRRPRGPRRGHRHPCRL